MLCWYDLALFCNTGCLAVGMSHKYFFLYFFFWLVKRAVGICIFIITFDTVYNLETLETVFQQPWKGLVQGREISATLGMLLAFLESLL